MTKPIYLISPNITVETAPLFFKQVLTATVQGKGHIAALQLRSRQLLADDGTFAKAVIQRLRIELATRDYPIVLNTRVDLVTRCGADGAHLTKHSISASDARALLPKPYILGYSAHSVAEALAAIEQEPTLDYLLLGPIFEPLSKSSDGNVLGIAPLTELCSQTNVSVYALGGITASRVQMCRTAGAAGVAGISFCFGESAGTGATAEIIAAWEEGA